MYLSCHTEFSPDFVLADSARVNDVFVSVCANMTGISGDCFSLLSVRQDDTAVYSLQAFLKSQEYRLTGLTVFQTITVTVYRTVILMLTAVRILVRDIVQAFREALYLLDCLFRC